MPNGPTEGRHDARPNDLVEGRGADGSTEGRAPLPNSCTEGAYLALISIITRRGMVHPPEGQSIRILPGRIIRVSLI